MPKALAAKGQGTEPEPGVPSVPVPPLWRGIARGLVVHMNPASPPCSDGPLVILEAVSSPGPLDCVVMALGEVCDARRRMEPWVG